MIPAPKRAERRRRFEKRLANYTDADGYFPDELDVSDKLIDRCITMWDCNSLAYLGVEFCTKRSMELVGVNKDSKFQPTPDASGVMKFKAVEDDERASKLYDPVPDVGRLVNIA